MWLNGFFMNRFDLLNFGVRSCFEIENVDCCFHFSDFSILLHYYFLSSLWRILLVLNSILSMQWIAMLFIASGTPNHSFLFLHYFTFSLLSLFPFLLFLSLWLSMILLFLTTSQLIRRVRGRVALLNLLLEMCLFEFLHLEILELLILNFGNFWCLCNFPFDRIRVQFHIELFSKMLIN